MQLLKVLMCNFIIAFAVFAFSCGGGGGDGDSDFKPVNPALVGKYQLKDFTVKFSNGTTIYPKNVDSFSGTMNITSNNSVTQNVCIKPKGMANSCVKGAGWIEGNTFTRLSVKLKLGNI